MAIEQDLEHPIDQCYNGIRGLKKAGVEVSMTPEQAAEIVKCSEDPIYFIENYCNILHVDDGIIQFKPFDYQKKIVQNILENRFSIYLIPRQFGKCYARFTKYKVRNKKTGVIHEVTAEQFHELTRRKSEDAQTGS